MDQWSMRARYVYLDYLIDNHDTDDLSLDTDILTMFADQHGQHIPYLSPA